MAVIGKRLVRETAAEIAAFTRDAAGIAVKKRIAMIRLFGENPGRSFADVAVRIGVSERTVKRWWRLYDEGGISGLLGRPAGSAAATDRPFESAAGSSSSPSSQIMTSNVIEFLNALPQKHSGPISPIPFRDALLKLLPDVDHVSVTVNRACDLTEVGEYRPKVVITQHTEPVLMPIMANRDASPDEVSQRLIDNYRHQGFAVERYHQPLSYIYQLSDGAYLGAIFLWREREQKPVTAPTLDLMARLRPFFEFLFSDLVARFRYSDPVSASYIEAIEEFSANFGLTPPEQQVVVMIAEGYKVKIMAERLMISPHTVKTHMKSIFKKAGVHSVAELIARYLAPGRNQGPKEPTENTKPKKGTRSRRK